MKEKKGKEEKGATATMALISARTILTSVSLFHLTLAFFFLTNPGTIADQAIVYVIGEAMGMVCSNLLHSLKFCLWCLLFVC